MWGKITGTSALFKIGSEQVVFDDKFELGPMIGRGRSSVVYKGFRLPSNEVYDPYQEPVALKVLQDNYKSNSKILASGKARAEREARALITCVHNRVVRLYDYVAREDLSYLSLEVAELGDLGLIFKESKRRLGVKAVVKLVESILEGVSAIHAAGIIHRDIKLENIFLTADYQVKIGDFGVCLFEDDLEKLGNPNEIVGTIEYQAPEVLRGGNFSIQSDLYSVGILVYRIITGDFPFGGRSLRDGLFQKIRGEYVDLPVSLINKYPQFEDFFKKALNPKPEHRFIDAKDMSKNLKQCLEPLINKENKDKNFTDIKQEELQVSRKINLELLSSILNKKIFISCLILGILLGFILPLFSSLDKNSLNSESINIISPSKYALIELTKLPAAGVIKDLYTPGRDYRFTLSPLSKTSVLFGLAIPGWQSVQVDISKLSEDMPLKIEGRGISLLLKIESRNGSILTGKYENLILGSRGDFSIKLVSDEV